MSVCSSAIESTFPLFNFKNKHIFGILMALRKFLKRFRAPGENPFFFPAADSAVPISFSFTTAVGGAPPEGEGNAAEGGCFPSNEIRS